MYINPCLVPVQSRETRPVLSRRCWDIKKQIKLILKQEGQVALNRSPEFCLKVTYRYLLKGGHALVDNGGGAFFGPLGIL